MAEVRGRFEKRATTDTLIDDSVSSRNVKHEQSVNDIPLKSTAIKVALVGAAQVGKSKLCQALQADPNYPYSDCYYPTVGVDCHSLKHENRTIQLWDIAGNEMFPEVIADIYKDPDIHLFAFALDNEASLHALTDRISTTKYRAPNRPCLLIGLKCDELKQSVTQDQINAFVQKHQLTGYLVVSAKESRFLDTLLAVIVTLATNELVNVERTSHEIMNTYHARVETAKSLQDLSEIIEQAKPEINKHRHEYFDRFFGKSNTESWKRFLKQTRDKGLKLLTEKVQNARLETDEDIKELLQEARNLPVFALHRNNSIFWGAFGRTRAQRAIDNMIAQLDSQHRLRK